MGYMNTGFFGKSARKIRGDNSFFGRTGLFKRTADIFISFTALVFLLPILIGVALAVKLTSSGNIFYLDERVGADGKTFSMFKFRSMYDDSGALLKQRLETCEQSREEWAKYQKLKNDPRITPVGFFLRKSSIDELPQFLNVLLGSMSIVGQRPIKPAQKDLYGDASFNAYIKARPGITGPWQVGGRNSVSFEQRINLETDYMRNWSLWLDLKILLKTVPTVLFPRGAL